MVTINFRARGFFSILFVLFFIIFTISSSPFCSDGVEFFVLFSCAKGDSILVRIVSEWALLANSYFDFDLTHEFTLIRLDFFLFFSLDLILYFGIENRFIKAR